LFTKEFNGLRGAQTSRSGILSIETGTLNKDDPGALSSSANSCCKVAKSHAMWRYSDAIWRLNSAGV
jgi:hypothetical protein